MCQHQLTELCPGPRVPAPHTVYTADKWHMTPCGRTFHHHVLIVLTNCSLHMLVDS